MLLTSFRTYKTNFNTYHTVDTCEFFSFVDPVASAAVRHAAGQITVINKTFRVSRRQMGKLKLTGASACR
jgi:hypothetical protein